MADHPLRNALLLIGVLALLGMISQIGTTSPSGAVVGTGTTVTIEQNFSQSGDLSLPVPASATSLRASAEVFGEGSVAVYVRTDEGVRRVFAIEPVMRSAGSMPLIQRRQHVSDVCEDTCVIRGFAGIVIVTNNAMVMLHNVSYTVGAPAIQGALTVDTPTGGRPVVEDIVHEESDETTPLEPENDAIPSEPSAPTQEASVAPPAPRPTPAPSLSIQDLASLDSCGMLNDSYFTYTLSTNVNATGNCYSINGTNVVLDCNGFNINYSEVGRGHGVVANDTNNITVRNCNFGHGDGTVGISDAINFTNVNNSYVIDSNFTINGSASGRTAAIYFENAHNNTIANLTINRTGLGSGNIGVMLINSSNATIVLNRIVTDGSGSDNYGILINDSRSQYVRLELNNISTNGTTKNYGLFIMRASNNTVMNNTIVTNGTSSNYGIYAKSNVQHTSFTNNSMWSRGTGATNYGIFIEDSANNNRITGNYVDTNGTSDNIGIILQSSAHNNSIEKNDIRARGSTTGNYGVELVTSTSNNTIVNNTIGTNGTSSNYGIYFLGVAHDNIVRNNSIRPGGTSSTNIGIRLDSTINNNRLTGNYIETNGTSGNTGILIISTANNNSVSDNEIRAQGSGASTRGIELSSTVTNTTVANNTIITNGTAFNYGVYMFSGIHDTLVANNSIRTRGNGGSATQNYGIFVSSIGNNNRLIRNFINTNGTTSNIGIFIQTTANDNTVSENDIHAQGSSSSNFGIELASTVGNTTITNNTIFTNGTSSNYGIYFLGAIHDNIIANNSVHARGTTFNYGVMIESTAHNNRILANRITTNGTSDNVGIRLFTTANNNTVSDNNIRSQGSTTGNTGIELNTGVGNTTIANNTILTNGTSTNYGIYLVTSVHDNILVNNSIRTHGTAGSNQGIRLAFTVRHNRVMRNFVETNGTSSNTGIIIDTIGHNNSIIENDVYARGSMTSNIGIQLFTTVGNTTVANNTVLANGSTTIIGIYVANGAHDNSIMNNSVRSRGSNSVYGTYLTSTAANNRLSRNTVDAGATTGAVGMRFLSVVNNNTVEGNEVLANGTGGGHHALLIMSDANNNTFANNTLWVDGGADNRGIAFTGTAHGNTFLNTHVRSDGIGSYGLFLQVSNATFNNTVLNATRQWIFIDQTVNTSLHNTSFVLPDTTIRFQGLLNTSADSFNVTTTKLNLGFGGAFLNSSNLSFMNASANVTFRGLALANPQIMVDADDDGTFTPCAGTTCEQRSYVGGTFDFNVAHFTNYSAQETLVCGAINTNVTMTENLNSTGDCFRINASNVVLDCANFLINYSQGVNGHGIVSNATANITIRNCNVVSGSNATNMSHGINLTNVQYAVVSNTTVLVTGNASRAIHLINVINSTVNGSILQTTGTGRDKEAIHLSNSTNNTIVNNTIRSEGTGVENFGLAVVADSTRNLLSGNHVMTNGSDFNYALHLLSGNNNTVSLNNMTARGSGPNNHAILVVSSENVISGNVLVANSSSGSSVVQVEPGARNIIANNTVLSRTGSNAAGVYMVGAKHNVLWGNVVIVGDDAVVLVGSSHNNTFDHNNLTAGSGYAVSIADSNGSHFNNTLFTNPASWLEIASNTNNTFTNTSFVSFNATVRFARRLNATAGFFVTQSNFNIGNSRAFLNTTNISFMNQSANITFRAVSSQFPQIIVDTDDDGVFAACQDTVCQHTGFAGSILEFNVAHFTNYSVGDGCGVVNGNRTLVGGINGTGTCLVINASNIVLDCAGHTINYSQGSAGHAIVAERVNNLTIRNCNIANVAQTGAHGVNLTDVNGSIVANNTILVDGVGAAGIFMSRVFNISVEGNIINTTGSGNYKFGITLTGPSLDNIIQNNTIGTEGTLERNGGLNVSMNASRNLIRDNRIRTNGTHRNFGIFLDNDVHNTTIANNTVATQGSADRNHAIFLQNNVSGTLIQTNVLSTNATIFNDCVALSTRMYRNAVTNNSCFASGSGAQNHGVLVFGDANANNITDNMIVTSGTSDNDGIQLSTGPSGVYVANNHITARGMTGDNNGVEIVSASGIADSNIVTNNTINSTGGVLINLFSNAGITINNKASHNVIANNTITVFAAEGGHGIDVNAILSTDTLLNNTFIGNTIVSNGTNDTHGVRIRGNASNTTLINTIITANAATGYAVFVATGNGTRVQNSTLQGASHWIHVNDTADLTVINLTFSSTTGALRPAILNATGPLNVTRHIINVSGGSVFVNTSNVTPFNTSARITIRQLTLGDPRPTIDVDDDGTFAACGASVCTENNYSGGSFVFDVTHFTAYGAEETPAAPSTGGGGGGGSSVPPPEPAPPVPTIEPAPVTPQPAPLPSSPEPEQQEPAVPQTFSIQPVQGSILGGGDALGGASCAFIRKLTAPSLSVREIDPQKIEIPRGFELAVQPFRMECAGDALDMTLSVPEDFEDLKVLRCNNGVCHEDVTTALNRQAMVCGATTLSLASKTARKRTSLVTELAAVVTTQQVMQPPGGTLQSGNARLVVTDVQRPVQVRFGIPDKPFEQPRNPTISIVGAPVQVSMNGSQDVRMALTLQYPVIEGLDITSIKMAYWQEGAWHVVEGIAGAANLTVTLDGGHPTLRDGTAVFALLGSLCDVCQGSRMEAAYQPSGALDAVILVHGLFSDPTTFEPLVREINFTRQPFAVYTFSYSFNQSLQQSGKELADAIDRVHAPYERIGIIGHSAGGIVAQHAMRHAADASQREPATYAMLPKVEKVIMVGTPTQGILSRDIIGKLGEFLVNTKATARLFNINSKVFREVIDPDTIMSVPGIKYVVLAGTLDYGFPVMTVDEHGRRVPTDGVVALPSAQTVGEQRLTDACTNYFELNLTHTDLIDNEVAVRVIQRAIFEGRPGAPGYNQYLQVSIDDCNAQDSYYVIGRRIDKRRAPQPLACGCGNGRCGIDEDDTTCPQDCAALFTRTNVRFALPFLEWLLVFIAAIVIVTGPVRKARTGRLRPRGLVPSLACVTVAMLVGIIDAFLVNVQAAFTLGGAALGYVALVVIVKYNARIRHENTTSHVAHRGFLRRIKGSLDERLQRLATAVKERDLHARQHQKTLQALGGPLAGVLAWWTRWKRARVARAQERLHAQELQHRQERRHKEEQRAAELARHRQEKYWDRKVTGIASRIENEDQLQHTVELEEIRRRIAEIRRKLQQ